MNRLLDPATLLSIKDLSLAARTTIEGFMAGLHKSNIRGEGIEFSQYRSYQPGDDLRQLDWKLFARSDRYYIRESAVETSVNVRIILDASASMEHTGKAYTKTNYAAYLAASLGWLAMRQGDAAGLGILTGNGLEWMNARRDFQHLQRMVNRLENVKAAGKAYCPPDLGNHFGSSHSRELIVFISDLYEHDDELLRTLESLAVMKHEVMVLHLLADNELRFDFKGYNTLEDLETGKRVTLNSHTAGEQYNQKLATYLQETRNRMLKKDIYYRMMNIDEPVNQALRDFLRQRQKLHR